MTQAENEQEILNAKLLQASQLKRWKGVLKKSAYDKLVLYCYRCSETAKSQEGIPRGAALQTHVTLIMNNLI